MERLTFWNKRLQGGAWDVPLRTDDDRAAFIPSQEIIDRLAAYEDTGMEPEEVQSIDLMRRNEEEAKLAAMWGYGIDPDRLNEIITAEAEGRLLVLPCKVGTPIFWINFNQHDGSWIETGTFTLVDIYAFGKSVFLTREEAEAARKEGDNG